ncbi:hypothetical protein GCM10017744_003500 [Streptomyces antimycoticus]|uniref:Tc1-like transposase DDE domain-containing protein n=1 Tax=Streptomyces antimycoticus TaxID=68175 RepID=A0A4D4KSB9_9ACTN|nr:hypothetical protein SANT12839_096150 [Streptomyces antimycoticus]
MITDNLSAHKGADVRRWAKKNKVGLCFTPTYASWGQPDRGPLRTAAAIHHRQLEPPPSHGSDPGPAHLPALAQRQRPPPGPPGRRTAERKERARIRSEKSIRWAGRPLATAA